MSLELHVARTLAASGWESAHSAWYRDVREQKDREIDVDALRVWQLPCAGALHTIRLHIIAECKTVKGGQILFAREAAELQDGLYFHWLDPEDGATHARLFQLLVRGGVSDRAAEQAIRRFHEAMYPEGQSLFYRLIPPPPPVLNRVTAGQELGKIQHFLWEASQMVYSAIENTTSELFELSLDEVRDRIPHGSEQRIIEECIEAMASEADTLTLFHPVIVTDAHLWVFDAGGEPEPVTSCRVTQTRIATRVHRWIDIVQEDELTAWTERTTRWYLDAFTNAARGPESPEATSAG